jgi:hypothetical protein
MKKRSRMSRSQRLRADAMPKGNVLKERSTWRRGEDREKLSHVETPLVNNTLTLLAPVSPTRGTRDGCVGGVKATTGKKRSEGL